MTIMLTVYAETVPVVAGATVGLILETPSFPIVRAGMTQVVVESRIPLESRSCIVMLLAPSTG